MHLYYCKERASLNEIEWPFWIPSKFSVDLNDKVNEPSTHSKGSIESEQDQIGICLLRKKLRKKGYWICRLIWISAVLISSRFWGPAFGLLGFHLTINELFSIEAVFQGHALKRAWNVCTGKTKITKPFIKGNSFYNFFMHAHISP